ncbi:putative membrane protein, partial [Chlamydia psittaci 02DC14]
KKALINIHKIFFGSFFQIFNKLILCGFIFLFNSFFL